MSASGLYSSRSRDCGNCVVASIVARDLTIVRCGAIAEVEHHLVDVTPSPAFRRVIVMALIEAHGAVVSRNALMARVWHVEGATAEPDRPAIGEQLSSKSPAMPGTSPASARRIRSSEASSQSATYFFGARSVH
jgi:hypothetical protein